jgi:thioredoxin 1
MLHLDDSNFDQEISRAVLPVIVDFYADWCGPCKVMAPIFEEVGKEMEGKMVFVKLDVDKANATALKYQTMSIPTMIIFKAGKEVKRTVGYQDKATLLKFIN